MRRVVSSVHRYRPILWSSPWRWSRAVPQPCLGPFVFQAGQHQVAAGAAGRAKHASQPRPLDTSSIDQTRLLNFRRAIEHNDLIQVTASYGDLARAGQLGRHDTLLLTRWLLYAANSSRSYRDEAKAHAQIVASLYRTGHLTASRPASFYLLASLKSFEEFEQGLEFWQWLQQTQHVDPSITGVALVLLAAAGQDANVCESTLANAISSLEDPLSRRLTSPNAVLPNNLRELKSHRDSMDLLVGTAEARLIYGNWKGAYLALESLLRIDPVRTPQQALRAFLNHRPLEECIRILNIFGRSGTKIGWRELSSVFQQLNEAIEAELKADTDRLYHVHQCVLAQLSLLQTCVAARLEVPRNVGSLVTKGLLYCFPFQHSALSLEQQSRFLSLANIAEDLMLSIFGKLHAAEKFTPLATLVVALQQDNGQLAKQALDRSLTWLQPGTHHFKQYIRVMLENSHGTGIIGYFVEVMTRSGTEHHQYDIVSALIDNVTTRREVSLCDELVRSSGLPPKEMSMALARLQKKAEQADLSQGNIDHVKPRHSDTALKRQENRILTLIDKLREISAMLDNPATLDVRAVTSWPTLSQSLCDFPEEWHTSLYNDIHAVPLRLTIAARSPSKPIDKLKGRSAKGGFVARARFEAFKSINNLLLLADAREMLGAPQNQQHPPSTGKELKSETAEIERFLLNDSSLFPQSEEEWRRRVLSLRGAKIPKGGAQ